MHLYDYVYRLQCHSCHYYVIIQNLNYNDGCKIEIDVILCDRAASSMENVFNVYGYMDIRIEL